MGTILPPELTGPLSNRSSYSSPRLKIPPVLGHPSVYLINPTSPRQTQMRIKKLNLEMEIR